MTSRRQFLVASLLGLAALPASARFDHPIHQHQAAIEEKLKVWREHVRNERSVLATSQEPHIVAWRTANDNLPRNPEADLLSAVNWLINTEITYKSDYAVHKTRDYWATIDDALIHGGDCEDYALAKATTLGYHGWPETHSHLVVGLLHRNGKSVPHAILVAERSDGTFWALDNLNLDVIPADRMPMTPLYGVDEEGVWIFKRPKLKKSG